MEQTTKWNEFYSSPTRQPFLHFSNEQLDSILKEFPNSKTALDIGCGEGELMEQLEDRTIVPTGIDLSAVALSNAILRTSGRLVEGDFEKMNPEEVGIFDIIFAKFVVAFATDLSHFVKNASTCIAPKGALIVVSPIITRPKGDTVEEEVFVEESKLHNAVEPFFTLVSETILFSEPEKRLSILIYKKRS